MGENKFWSTDFLAKIDRINSCLIKIEDPALKKEISVGTVDKLKGFISKTEDAIFQVAFVGTIKAGKSTLINALLRGDYASTSVSPETAVLTKFSDSRCEKFFIEIEYYTRDEWNAIWKQIIEARSSEDISVRDRIRPFWGEYEDLGAEEVKDQYLGRNKERVEYDSPEELTASIASFTSSKSRFHYFIKEVHVGIKKSGLPERLVICDTPGLDDVLEYRSNVTKKYINNADAVFVCVDSSFLGGEQLHTIQNVFSINRFHPERVYIVGTKLDKLSAPLTDWNEQKSEWMKYLRGKACYRNEKLAYKNIIGVSSWIEHILNKGGDISVNQKEYLSLCLFACNCGIDTDNLDNAEELETLRRYAGIESLRLILNNRIFKIYRKAMEKQLYKEYELLKAEVVSKIEQIIIRNKDLRNSIQLETSELSRKLELLEREKESNQKKLEEFKRIHKDICDNVHLIENNIKEKLDMLDMI